MNLSECLYQARQKLIAFDWNKIHLADLMHSGVSNKALWAATLVLVADRGCVLMIADSHSPILRPLFRQLFIFE